MIMDLGPYYFLELSPGIRLRLPDCFSLGGAHRLGTRPPLPPPPPSFRHYTASDRKLGSTWEWGGATTDVHLYYFTVCLFILPQCLVIGEITCDHMIVVLNKIDLVEPSKREAQIAKVTNTQPVSPLMSSKGNMFLMIFEQAVEYYTHALLRAFSL